MSKSMLDVEYLLSLPVSLRGSLVYKYKSGVLRRAMRNALSAMAARDNRIIFSCEPEDLPLISQGSGLISGIPVCEWSSTKDDASHALEVLCNVDGEPIALFAREEDELFSNPQWPKVEALCLLVEEPTITLATLQPALSYLQARSDLTRGRNFIEQKSFRTYFNDLLQEWRSMEFPDLRQEFDKAILLYVDPKTGIFFGEISSREQRRDRNAVMRPLRSLVANRDPSRLPELLRGLRRRFLGRGGRELADELARNTSDILMNQRAASPAEDRHSNEHTSDAGDRLDRTGSIVWSSVLLAWTNILKYDGAEKNGLKPRADLALVTIDQMSRDCLQRLGEDESDDPLSGLWEKLRELIVAGTDTPQRRLMRDLRSHLVPPFLRR